jgi:ribonuclease E
MSKKMLIDAGHPEEIRVAVLDARNQLEELDFETTNKRPLKGNVYLARVTRVEPSLQAAFVEYGGNRHGFLPFGEIHPDYFRIPVDDRRKIEAEIRETMTPEDDDIDPLIPKTSGSKKPSNKTEKVPEIKVSSTATFPDVIQAEAQTTTVATELEIDAGKLPTTPEVEATVQFIPESATPEEAPAGPSQREQGRSRDPNARNRVRQVESGHDDEIEQIGGEGTEEFQSKRRRRLSFHDRYKIQEVIQKGQVLLIQVVKEERKAKGAALTTYLSFAGRYCVLMPNSPQSGGVSRKIASPQERRSLKDMLHDLKIPDGMSMIIRTAGKGLNKAEIKRDYEYLLKLWNRIREVTLQSVAPALIYEEANLIKRAIRDMYTKDITDVIIDGEDSYVLTKRLFRELMPAHEKRVKLYTAKDVPFFHAFGVEKQVESLHRPEVQLPSGGSIVFNQTEALVAIDINSGRSTRERNVEQTALQTNLEAADQIALQLRLRDLAGLVVIDFIDMDETDHKIAVENRLKSAMNVDRARIQIGRISSFGLLELSRQRLRPSILEISSIICPHCKGTGMLRAMESQAMDLLHAIEGVVLKNRERILSFRAAPEIVEYLQNYKRADLSNLELQHDLRIFLEADSTFIPPDHELIIGDLHSPAYKAAVRKRDQATFDKHKDRLQLHEQAPIHDMDFDESAMALSPDEVIEEAGPPEQYNQGRGSQDDSRRRGRRGGRRRGPGARVGGGPRPPYQQHHQGQGQGPRPQQGTPAQAGDKPKKSWWQRLLE